MTLFQNISKILDACDGAMAFAGILLFVTLFAVGLAVSALFGLVAAIIFSIIYAWALNHVVDAFIQLCSRGRYKWA